MLTTGRILSSSGSSLVRSVRLLNRTSSLSSSDYDLIISGGGLVGSALAASVRHSPVLAERRVLLLESAKKKSAKATSTSEAEYSNRVVALNSSTRSQFERLGTAWPDMERVRVKPVHGMTVWDHSGTKLAFGKGQMEPFYIVENDLVVECLVKQYEDDDAKSNVEVRYESGVKECRYDADAGLTRVVLADGETTLTTRLLVGADGANSLVRRSMQPATPYIAKNYQQMGVVATLHLAEPLPNDVAWQKFLPSGPIALLPLSNDRSSLVWTLPTVQARAVIKDDPERVLGMLQRKLGGPPSVGLDPFPRVDRLTNLAGFPLGLGHSSRYCRPGMVLVGDSAHRVHPLAGQGVNLGFADVRSLVRHLELSVRRGAPFAAYDYLLDYETECQRHNVPMMMGIDFLQQVYCTSNPVVGAARNLGVSLVNASPSLKKLFAGFAA